MNSVVEEGNDKHMGPWAEACSTGGVENTPLTPFMDQELLYNKNLYLDGSRLKKLGFICEFPLLTSETLLEVSYRFLLKYFVVTEAKVWIPVTSLFERLKSLFFFRLCKTMLI